MNLFQVIAALSKHPPELDRSSLAQKVLSAFKVIMGSDFSCVIKGVIDTYILPPYFKCTAQVNVDRINSVPYTGLSMNISTLRFCVHSLFLPSFLLFSALSVQASTELPPLTVISSKALNAHNHVSFIDRQQLEDSKASDIFTPLYHSPSVVLNRGKASGINGMTIRGTSGGSGVVTFDGIPIFASFAGFVPLRLFPADVVQSLTVDRGFSTKHSNSHTLGGHVALESRRISDESSQFLIEAGSDDTLKGSIGTGWGDKQNATLVIGRTVISDGQSESSTHTPNEDNDNDRISHALFRADVTFERGNIEASLYYADAKSDTDGPGLTPQFTAAWLDDPNGWLADELLVSQMTVNLDVTGNWHSTLQLGYTRDKQSSEVGTLPTGPISMGITSELTLANWQNQHQLMVRGDTFYKLQWGISSQYQQGNVSKTNQNNSQTLISPEIGLSIEGKNWDINGLTRIDHYDEFGEHKNYALSTNWQLSPALSLWANHGRKYRAPSITERMHPLFGNQALKPEHNAGGEIGLAWQQDNTLHTSLSLYQHAIHDLVVLAVDPATGATRSNNINKVKTTGGELSIEKEWSDRWSSRFNYTYMDAENTDTHLTVAVRPEHRINLSNQWQLTTPLSLRLDLTAHDGFWYDAGNTLWSGSAIKINSVLNYTYNEKTEFYIRADNLTDDDTVELLGFESAHRAVYAGAVVTF